MSLKDAARRRAAPVQTPSFAGAGLKQPTIRVNFNLDKSRARLFKSVAAAQDETMTEALTMAVDEYISKYS